MLDKQIIDNCIGGGGKLNDLLSCMCSKVLIVNYNLPAIKNILKINIERIAPKLRVFRIVTDG